MTDMSAIFYDILPDALTGLHEGIAFAWCADGLTAVRPVRGPLHETPLPSTWQRSEGRLLERFPALARLLAGDDVPAAAFPLALSGTVFQRAVWAQIAAVPYGQTISYRELAARAGKPEAIRAAGTACGANPVPLIIPCHRILASNGTLGGFGWGLETKRMLLRREQRASVPNAA